MEEVLGHALILTSPIAACYGAKLLSRLIEQMEETSRSFYAIQSLARVGVRALRRIDFSAKRAEQIDGRGCFQYENAAFCSQSMDGYGVDVADGDDDDMDFCILTPQQALGALGDHASQYTKIFLNGSTFVTDLSEPGTVLSVDEYADRMHVALSSRHQSAGGSPSTGSPSVGPVVAGSLAARHATDGGAPGDRLLSRRSDTTSLTSLTTSSSCGRTYSNNSDRVISARSSMDISIVSYSPSSSYAQYDRQSAPAIPDAEKDAIEDSPYCDTASQRCPQALEVSVLGKAHACMWRDAAAAAAGGAAVARNDHVEEDDSDLASCPEPRTPRELAAPPRPAASPSTAGDCCSAESAASAAPAAPSRRAVRSGLVPRELAFGRTGSKGCAAAAAATTPGVCSSGRQQTPRSASYGGAVSLDRASQQRRCWVPAGARSMPPPLPSPIGSREGSPLSSSLSSSRTTSMILRDGDVTCTWNEVASAPHSPQPSGRSRPCGIVTPGAAPNSPSACPTGLSKAPALPLPDGATLESEVPPALRYYLAQARAVQDGHEAEDGADAVAHSEGGIDAEMSTAAGNSDVAVGRPGFVRATVEQLNTQRLVCCHVTPFAAAKTSRKPRPLAHRVAGIK